MSKEYRWKLPLIAAVVAIAILLFSPPSEKLKKGIDLEGGSELLYTVSLEEIDKTIEDLNGRVANMPAGEQRRILVDQAKSLEASKSGAVAKAIDIIRLRIDGDGTKELPIQRQGQDRVLIQLPGMTKAEVNFVKERISRQGVLTFQMVASDAVQAMATPEKAPEGFAWYPQRSSSQKLLVNKYIEVPGSEVDSASKLVGQFGGSEVGLKFTQTGRKLFGEVTKKNIGSRMAILLDGVVQSSPTIQGAITQGNASITGQFTPKEVSELVAVLRAGSLPAKLVFQSESFVGPTLGEDSVKKGFTSCLYGLLAVLAFMGVYYLAGGMIANLAVIINLVLILGAIALTGASITLPGIAGIILTVGMCVDANVLIFERIREEIAGGTTLGLAIRNGYDRAFVTIVDANLTTLFTAFILAQYGTGPIKGFAVTLSIGILASMFSALFVTRTLTGVLYDLKIIKTFKMMSLVKTPKFDFMGISKAAMMMSALAVVLGLGLFFSKGKSLLDIDFTGGTLVQFKLTEDKNLTEVREALMKQNPVYKKAALQSYAATQEAKLATRFDQFTLRVQAQTDAEVNQVLTDIAAAFSLSSNEKDIKSDGKVFPRIETVGGVVAQELQSNAIVSIVLAILVIVAYISIRFEFKFGLAAIVALIHDVSITLGVFALAEKKINLPMIAAILTIIGYSLNDTIVVFDRIRENIKRINFNSYSELLNMSIGQTLSRTVLTSLTTLMVVVILFFYGGGIIEDFAFTLIVGVLVGTYSSIFVASPILNIWNKKETE